MQFFVSPHFCPFPEIDISCTSPASPPKLAFKRRQSHLFSCTSSNIVEFYFYSGLRLPSSSVCRPCLSVQRYSQHGNHPLPRFFPIQISAPFLQSPSNNKYAAAVVVIDQGLKLVILLLILLYTAAAALLLAPSPRISLHMSVRVSVSPLPSVLLPSLPATDRTDHRDNVPLFLHHEDDFDRDVESFVLSSPCDGKLRTQSHPIHPLPGVDLSFCFVDFRCRHRRRR